MAVLVPSNRDLCVLIAESINSERDLTPEQIAAFRALYRLDDTRKISDLVTAGEISPISNEEITSFIRQLETRRINTRVDFDHAMAFLRGVTDPEQKAQIREILPSVTKTEYFLIELLHRLDSDKGDVIISSHKCSCGGKCTTDGSMCGLIGTDECKRGDLP